MATDEGTIQVREVIDPPFATKRDSSPLGPSVLPKHQGITPLEQLKAQVGVLLVPTYLPQGFTLDESFLHLGQLARFVYKRDGATLVITHETYPPKVEVKAGFSRSISVGPYDGYMVDGGWFHISNGSVEWAEGLVRVLIFERDGVFLVIRATPGSQVVKIAGGEVRFPSPGIDEAELIKVAESLQPY